MLSEHTSEKYLLNLTGLHLGNNVIILLREILLQNADGVISITTVNAHLDISVQMLLSMCFYLPYSHLLP